MEKNISTNLRMTKTYSLCPCTIFTAFVEVRIDIPLHMSLREEHPSFNYDLVEKQQCLSSLYKYQIFFFPLHFLIGFKNNKSKRLLFLT